MGSKSRRHLELESFCSPVDLEEGISDDTTHLTCYEKEHWRYSKHFKSWRWKDEDHRHRSEKRELKITNIFGPQTLRIRKAETLCVPTEIDGTPSALDLDRFKCFEAKKGRGAKFKKTEVTIGEQTVKVIKPVAFCAPVDDEHKLIEEATNHLTCYKVKIKRSHNLKYGKWGHGKYWQRSSSQKITVNNELGERQKLKVSEIETICVPSSISMSTSSPPKADEDEDHDSEKKEKENDDDD